MKRIFWYGMLVLVLAGPARAQSLTGVWQGVETDSGEPDLVWPALLRLQQPKGGGVLGVLYQEAGDQPGVSVTFQVQGTRTASGLRLEHVRKLTETGHLPFFFWCEGAITFTYDASQEKLTGRATYRPTGDCDIGTFTLYRIRLKSGATVPANTESTIRVSGKNVLWYADADLRQPLTTGNAYRTKLSKTTTFYLTQGYYPTRQSTAVPITIRVTDAVAALQPSLPAPLPVPPDTARIPLIPAPTEPATPVVLPTVLFRLGTAELLLESRPALDQLAAELNAHPLRKLQVAGHTDKIGEPQKNQTLSEQRAAAVKTHLVKAGVAAERISTVGYGDARPLYPSPDARNRRVEVAEVAN